MQKNVTKILWLKKSYSRMLLKTESKVLVWPKILFKCLLLCLWKIWISKIGDSIYRIGLEGSGFLNFLYWPKFSLCWVICAFHLEQYWTKISLFIPRLMQKSLIGWNLLVYFSRKWNLMTGIVLHCSLSFCCWMTIRCFSFWWDAI